MNVLTVYTKLNSMTMAGITVSMKITILIMEIKKLSATYSKISSSIQISIEINLNLEKIEKLV